MSAKEPLSVEEHLKRSEWHLSRAESMGGHAGGATSLSLAHSNLAVAKLLQAQVGSESKQAPMRKAD